MGSCIKISVLTLLFYTLLLNKGLAQCTGAFGDVVAGTYFGTGSNFYGSPLDAANTGPYGFVEGQPNDKHYTIVKSTAQMDHVSRGAWHMVNDRENDPNGYIMVINADYDPGIFYQEKKTGLCANTTYRFSAYIVNLLRTQGNNPILTFIIRNAITNEVLQEFDAPEILKKPASPEWVERSTTFKTPTNVEAVIIQIRNNAPGGEGNDLALDDITFKPCGPDIIPSIDNDVSANKSLCIGDIKSFVLSAEVTPGVYTNPQYLWQEMDGSGAWQDLDLETSLKYTKKFEGAVVGSYKYRLLVAENGNINSLNCRTNSPIFELNVSPLPIPVANQSMTVCIGEPFNLTVSDASSYKWTGPNGFSSTIQSPVIPRATTEMAGTYYVTITNDAGCEASTQTEITIIQRPIATVDPIAPICKGLSAPLNVRADSDMGITYRWLPNASLSATDIPNPVATPEKTTTYTVYVSNGYCETPMNVTVHVFTPLQANAGPDLKIIKGNSIRLKGSVSGENIGDVFWTPSDFLDDPTKLNPIANPPFSMNYILNVKSATDCDPASDQVFVKVYDKLVVPNSFSPNDDGINDIWNVIAIDTYVNPTVKIMNRYGQLMFEGKGDKTAWNGKRGHEDVPVGVYYYIINLEQGLKPLTGSLTVIR